MDIRVTQDCPQCGAPVVLAESGHVLNCAHCGVNVYLQGRGLFRYALPLVNSLSSASDMSGAEKLFWAPYLRFKGVVYQVTESGIAHQVVDTTQVANPFPGLPPSLGVRPQAMTLRRIESAAAGRFLPQQLKAERLLEKAMSVSRLNARSGGGLFHRAFIGEQLSYIYLPVQVRAGGLYDAIRETSLLTLDDLPDTVETLGYNPDWSVRFLPAVCPQCGADLDGAGDCRVMTCANCQSAWSFDTGGLRRVEWLMHDGGPDVPLYLPFWKITAHIPALKIYSFADFVTRTNQPFLSRPRWRERAMSLWVPAFFLRPKVFLQVGRRTTLEQWKLSPTEARVVPNLFPATLPAGEARQSVKVLLAAASGSKAVFSLLPRIRLTEMMQQLVYLPYHSKGPDWVQPETGMAIGKNLLRFGRSLSF
ncbi:MAG: NADH pyrophosphatase zinc ribbon domain-containing protein [Desulfobulbus sp.]